MNKLKQYSHLIQTISCLVLILIAFYLEWAHLQTSSQIVFILAFLIGGYASAKEGIEELIYEKHLSVDVLMILAAIGAGLIGYWAEGALLIFIFSLSSTLETLAMEKSKNAISSLMALTPNTARKIMDEGNICEVLTSELVVGDRVQVRKGEAIPIDGTLIRGVTYLDESMITGEPLPVQKAEGDTVIGGTINQGETIEIIVTAASGDTLFDKIIAMVEVAQKTKSKTATFIEQLEDYYVKAVLICVPLFIVITIFILNWSVKDAFYRGMILLTVASPCALVASSTPATLSAISRSARKGMIVKGGTIMEKLADIQAIVMDKTGTLTQGKPQVVLAQFFGEETTICQVVAAAEKQSTHPIAMALVEYTDCGSHIKLDRVQEHIGEGLMVTVENNQWRIGKKEFISKNITHCFSKEVIQSIEQWESQGKTLIYVAQNQMLQAIFVLEDQLKEESIEFIRNVKEMGIKTIMLTGDQEKTAGYIAQRLGIDEVVANCMPQDKAQHIQQLQAQHGVVAMVGDGINDAPALVTADVSFAIGSGTDIAIESADVVLLEDLMRIPFSILLSKKMKRIVLMNICFAITVIISLIIANLFQFINLPLGVVGHEGSTILVILNGLRLLRFDDKK